MGQKGALPAWSPQDPGGSTGAEPLIGVDPAGQYAIKEEARKVTRRGGSVIVSTHMLDTAEKLCDRIAVMHRGRIAAMGTLAELRSTAQAGAGATLEDVFLRLTEEAGQPAPPEAPRRILLGRKR